MNERDIFEKAIEIRDRGQRDAFLDQACGADAALRKRLDDLLVSHDQASGFLNVPVVDQLPPNKLAGPHPTLQLPPNGPLAGAEPADDDHDDEAAGTTDLSFLQPSSKVGSIGRLGHYEILQILGQGAFGIVFQAFDEKLHRHVAIKAMNPQLASTSPPRKRFLREARSVAAIKHENIVQVHSVEEQPLPYLAMEFVDGQTLAQKLETAGPLEAPEILHLGRQMAAGLAAAHEKGLIHRDIKPGNILIEAGAEQKVKITDFGLARAADDATMTRTGTIAGTPMFMSPEQAMGQTLDHRSDLFSLGSVLYQMASGRPPFRGANAIAVLKRVVDETPRPIRDILPDVPDWLCAIIEKLHAKSPDERYQTAKEVADLLARCQNELQVNGQVTCVAVPSTAAAVKAAPAKAVRSSSLQPTLAESPPVAASAQVERPSAKPASHGPLIFIATAALLIFGLTAFELTGISNFFRKPASTDQPVPSGDAQHQTQVATVPTTSNSGWGGWPADAPKPSLAKVDSPTPTQVPTSASKPQFQPIPVGQSPFDKLDPAAIPADERFDWQPQELVAVIGSHTRRQWSFCNALAFSADGTQVITHHTNANRDVAIWDAATGKLLQTITSEFPLSHESGVFLLDAGKRLVLSGQVRRYQFYDSTGKQLAGGVLLGADGKPITFGTAKDLCEDSQTLIAESFDRTQILSYAIRENSLVFRDVIRDVPGGFGFKHRAVATSANRVFFEDNQKLFVCSIQDGKFGPRTELSIPLPKKDSFPIDVTPDGRTLVITVLGELGGAEVWDLTNEQPQRKHKVAFGGNFAISPDGKWLAAKANQVHLYRLQGEEPARTSVLDFTDAAGGLGELRFSNDGSKLVLGNWNGLVRTWDLSGSKPQELSPFDPDTAFPYPSGPWSTSLDDREGRILLPRFDRPEQPHGRSQVWDLNGAKPEPGTFLNDSVFGPVYALDDDRFVQICPDPNHSSALYRLKSFRFERVNKAPFAPSILGNVSPDRRTMVVYSPPENPTQIQGWDLSTDAPQQKWTLQPMDQRPLSAPAGCKVWFSANNRWFATQARGEQEGGPWELVLWRNTSATPEVHAMLPITNNPGLYRVAISPDGNYLAHCPQSVDEIILLDLAGKEPREIARYIDNTRFSGVLSLDFHPNGKHLTVGSHRGVCILDVTTVLPIWDWQSPGPVHWLDWAADGRHLVTHNGNLTVYVLRLNVEQAQQKLENSFAASREAAEWLLSLDAPAKRMSIEGRGAPNTPITRREELPTTPFRVTDVQPSDSPVTDDDLVRLGRLASLKALGIHRGNLEITDEGLEAFSQSPAAKSLTNFDLAFAVNVTDKGLRSLNRIDKLEFLSISGAALTEEGLSQLNLPHLRGITVAQTPKLTLGWLNTLAERSPHISAIGFHSSQLGEIDLSPLGRLQGLDSLDLIHAGLTDRSAKSLAKLPTLTRLRLMDNSGIHDEALIALVELPRLDTLWLHRTGITDAGLETLAKMKSLKELVIVGCQGVTEAGVRKLQAALPECQIASDYPAATDKK